jgi:aspartate aminotransferase-like enzyme
MPDVEDVVFLQPGPVKMHPRVLRAMGRPTLHHRSSEFQETLEGLTQDLKRAFDTKGDVTVLTGSGTAAMEAAVAGIAGRDDRVVVIENGKFGERMSEIAGMHSEAVTVKSPWGQAADLDAVAAALEESPTKALIFVHNETSTGVVNPAKELAGLARKNDALIIMDAVTSLGSVPVPVDEWGIDICITGSQKCLGGPAGLAMVSVSPQAYDGLRRFSYYLDLKRHVDKTREGSTPFTPAVPLYLGMREAVALALEEGLEARYARTRRLADATRAAAQALGLPFYAEADCRSDTVTSLQYPDGLPEGEKQVRGRLKQEFGVLVAGGQAQTKGKIFRVGHMANVNASEIMAFLHALEVCLADAGWSFPRGAGLTAASETLD